MVNINAMRTIVKHNVFKQLKQLSKSDQTKINDFITLCLMSARKPFMLICRGILT